VKDRLISIMRALWLTRHGEVRVPWRVALFLVSAAIIAMTLGVGLGWAGLTARGVDRAVLLASVLAATALMTRVVNRKPFGAAGFGRTRGAGRDFGLGCLLGFLMMAGIFLIELGMGYVHPEFRPIPPGEAAGVLASSSLLFAMGALGEEILFRGYPFQTIMQGVTFLPAALGVAALFACAHLGNPNISIFALVNIAMAGLWLSFAYLKTRTLWLPFGLHFSWNFCQTTLFSFPNSGFRMEDRTFFFLNQEGPGWITGGNFGPEGGILATLAIMLCTWHLLKSPLYRREKGVVTLDSIEDLLGSGGVKGEAP